MKLRYLFIIIFIMTVPFSDTAQEVNNVHFEQKGKEIWIYYDLESIKVSEAFNIGVFYSVDDGQSWDGPLKYLNGDIGENQVTGKNKLIIWDVLLEGVKLIGEIKFKVTAVSGEEVEMVFVQGGTFWMGQDDPNIGFDRHSSNEQPVHSVSLNSFYIGKYLVTNSQFCKFLNDINCSGNGSFIDDEYGYRNYISLASKRCLIRYKKGKFIAKKNFERFPVVDVTWYGANAFAQWADGRLLSEAEWEFAARGGNKSQGYIYSGSNSCKEVAWFEKNSFGDIQIIGTKSPNELGIYDMSGNVWEWCNDWYNKNYYSISPNLNPSGPIREKERVLRGGAWYTEDNGCRVTNRAYCNPDLAKYNSGFRIGR